MMALHVLEILTAGLGNGDDCAAEQRQSEYTR
jgi:hypothetical protein